MNQIHLFNCPTYFWGIFFFLNHLWNIYYSVTKIIKNKQGYSLKYAPCSYNILCTNPSSLLRFFYLSFQVQLLHFLVTVSYSNEGARLWLLLSATIPFHLLFFFLPSTAHKIHTRRRTKEPENEKCIMRLHKLLCTQSFLSPLILCIRVYTCTPFICLEDFLKCKSKKREKARKISIRCTVTEYLSSSIYGNSLHLYKMKTLSTLTEKRFLKKVKRPWKWWRCFAFVGMSWFKPSEQLCTMQLLTYPLPVG